MAREAELSFAAAANLRALCMARGDGESHAACIRARVSSRASDGDAMRAHERVQEHVAGHRAAFLAEAGPEEVLELAEKQVLRGIEDILNSSGAGRTKDTMGKDYDEFAQQGSPIAAARYGPVDSQRCALAQLVIPVIPQPWFHSRRDCCNRHALPLTTTRPRAQLTGEQSVGAYFTTL